MKRSLTRDLRSLALLLGQGQSLSFCLQRLASHDPFWLKPASQAESGASWTEIAAGFPSPLNTLVCEHEDFPANLRLCARLLEDQQRRRRFWRNVAAYPVLLCLAGLALGLFVSLVTRAEAQFLDQSLGILRALNRLSSFFLDCFPFFLCLPLALAGLLRRPNWRMRVPVLGYMARLRDSAAFLGWLELACRQHPCLPDVIALASQASVMAPTRRRLENLAEQLRSGSDLSRAQSGLPGLAHWALLQAQHGGFQSSQLQALTEMLEQKADYYQEFAASLLALGGYLLAGGMALWCSLCVLLPLRGVGNL